MVPCLPTLQEVVETTGAGHDGTGIKAPKEVPLLLLFTEFLGPSYMGDSQNHEPFGGASLLDVGNGPHFEKYRFSIHGSVFGTYEMGGSANCCRLPYPS